MKSEKKAQPSESPKDKEAKLAVVQQHPELLMAAREGDSARLNAILGNAAAGATPTAAHAGPPGVTINIIVEEADDVDKATGTTISMELELHNVLHVVASSGDSPTFLENARIIHGKAKHLLDACNQKGDTPFHCAARAGMVTMVTQLISLAEAEGGGDRVKLALRKQNKRRETALHEALRFAHKETVWAMVNKLMAADAELARFPPANGTSPLYLAVSLGHNDIAERLHELDQGLSYCGPNGQNVLHVAVLRCTSMTNSLLKWNNDLSKQGEQTNGSTPLHFAAFRGICERVELLLDTDKSLAYQCDNKGSFAIHEAVRGMQGYVCPWLYVIRTLLKKCPDCAQLRDAEGKTFLHVAAERDYAYQLWYCVLRGLRGKQQFASIMNMQDNDGNTGLHLAVMAGGLQTLFALLRDKEVLLNLSNNKGQTALDLSQRSRPAGVFFGLDPRISIDNLLKAAGAQYSAHIETHGPRLNEKEESEKIANSTQTIGVVSALLVTVSFAAAFTIPGGYRTEDDPNVLNIKGGMPVLITSNCFQAFIIANNLALLCSTMATISLMYAGVPTVDIRTRMAAFVFSIFFLNNSARTLAAAFALGMYATLAPAARAAATLTVIGTTITLLDLGWFVYKISTQELVLRNRLGVSVAMLRFAGSVLGAVLTCLWPYVIIASFLAYMKHHA